MEHENEVTTPPRQNPSSFDRERFEALRRQRGLGLGEPLICLGVTGSTNDDAMQAAREGAGDGTAFIADSQTSGRGRHGTRWISPPGENLLFSLVLRRDFTTERASTLTLAIGLGLRDAVAARVSAPVRIKWPNDLVVADQKLAGILLESQLTGGKVEAVVVGVGLNVAMRALPPEIAGIATSLALLGAGTIDRETFLCDVLEAVGRRVRSHEQQGLDPILDELRLHDALLGRRIRVDSVRGVACGISDAGALLVRDDSGQVHRMSSGSVSLEP